LIVTIVLGTIQSNNVDDDNEKLFDYDKGKEVNDNCNKKEEGNDDENIYKTIFLLKQRWHTFSFFGGLAFFGL